MLKISPHPDWPDKPGHCRATLYGVEGAKRREIWSRFLINNHAPVRVFVADSGEYVVTMDEWHSVGELPIVVYGKRGELIRVHSTDSLGLKDDVLHIKRTVSSYWWNEDSMSFFGPDEETFFIRLHWGKLVFISLEDGDLMDEGWYTVHKGWRMPAEKWKCLHDHARAEVRERALLWLRSENPAERKTGAAISGSEKLGEAIPRLRSLLTDQASLIRGTTTKRFRAYYVREAAKQAIENMGEQCDGVVVEIPDPSDASN